MNEPKLVSIVIAAYNESEALPELISELSQVGENRWGDVFEFVLVDDGSTDDTWQQLVKWQEHESRLTLVQLASNYGSHKATRAGLEQASGDARIVIPADLQEGLDLVEACLEKWHTSYKMAVMMVPKQERAYDRWIDKIAARLFYAWLRASTNLYGDLSLRAQAKLMDRVAATAFSKSAYSRSMRTPFVLRHGFPYDVVSYEVKKRSAGRSKWSFRRKVALVIDFFVDCSAWMLSPWRIAVGGGVLYTCLTILPGFGITLHGFVSTTADMCLAATVLLVLSILGIHVARIHQEIRGRPFYVIREIRRGKLNRAWQVPCQEPCQLGADANLGCFKSEELSSEGT